MAQESESPEIPAGTQVPATYKFQQFPISNIIVEDRIRENLGNVEDLAESIKLFGLFHPIVISREGNEKARLVAGGRRLAAMIKLDWTEAPVHFLEDLPEDLARVIELEENLKRTDLEWQDECKAVRELHSLKSGQDDTWTLEMTAKLIGISPEWVSRRITVADAVDSGDAAVSSAVGANAAYNLVRRRNSRELDDAMAEVMGIEDEIEALESKTGDGKEPASRFQVFEQDFRQFVQTYEGSRFNLIHCDFPYGIQHGKSAQGQAKSWDNPYADDPELYMDLLQTLCESKLVADSAHLVFWFSMNFYSETKAMLQQAGGWEVSPFPLIWYKSDNHGILPDSNRGPRRVYETAFLASRGDRLIVRPVSNVAAVPVGKKQHLSQKPAAMLQHFFRMLISDTTRILDPTCGSGTALAAAKSLGASHGVGLDIDPDHVALARRNISLTSPGGNDPDGEGEDEDS